MAENLQAQKELIEDKLALQSLVQFRDSIREALEVERLPEIDVAIEVIDNRDYDQIFSLEVYAVGEDAEQIHEDAVRDALDLAGETEVLDALKRFGHGDDEDGYSASFEFHRLEEIVEKAEEDIKRREPGQ